MYQIKVKVLLSKYKESGGREFARVHLNSGTKTVINPEYDLDKSFQEILYRINNWINEGSGRIIVSINAEYVTISIFSPLSISSYIKLPVKLRNSMKILINIKNSDNKCFPWGHIRHLNPLRTADKKEQIKRRLMILIFKVLNFLCPETITAILNKKIIFAPMYFVKKIIWLIQFMYQMKNLRIVWIY